MERSPSGDGARFVDSNRMSFRPSWTQAQVAWWRERMLRPYAMYPDDLGEALSRSMDGPKAFVIAELDVARDSFVVMVDGPIGRGGELWFTRRKLDLRGRVFEAQRMDVPRGSQGLGRGRLLMADLVETARLLDIPTIEIEAQDIGRYAWARFGFLPDRTAWNYQIKIAARPRLVAALPEIGEARFAYCSRVLDGTDPALVRDVASWNDAVTSREGRFDREPETTTLGRALLLETQAQWYGSFDLRDPETMSVYRAYVKDAS